MCGRYVGPDIRAIEREWELLHRSGGLNGRDQGLYNAAPTMLLPVVRAEDGKSFVQAMRWGFIPFFWKPEDKLSVHTSPKHLRRLARVEF